MIKASERQVGGDHYKSLPVQPGYYIRENGLGWYEGNIVKYITRWRQKGGVEDIRKVIHYAELILEELEEEEEEEEEASMVEVKGNEFIPNQISFGFDLRRKTNG